MTSTDLSQLKAFIDLIHPLPDKVWHKFSLAWKPFQAKRKEIISMTSEQEKYLYFVIEGVQRVYYYDELNHEATIVFTYSPSFGGILDSIMLKTESKYFYEALTNSSFLRIGVQELHQLMYEHPEIGRFIQIGLSQTIAGLIERLVELQSFSSEEKFRKLLQRSPHILQLVPHKYLANYLGIDPTNFSKLINKIRI